MIPRPEMIVKFFHAGDLRFKGRFHKVMFNGEGSANEVLCKFLPLSSKY